MSALTSAISRSRPTSGVRGAGKGGSAACFQAGREVIDAGLGGESSRETFDMGRRFRLDGIVPVWTKDDAPRRGPMALSVASNALLSIIPAPRRCVLAGSLVRLTVKAGIPVLQKPAWPGEGR
jgi:hypothetical protein